MPTREFITAVLAHRRFSELLGCTEDLWLEAKQNHEFDLGGNARHRFELTKDVSAMANAEGGFLLMGLRTEPVAEEHTDRVTELDLVAPGDFNADQFSGVIAEHVHPAIRGLRVEWIESAETAGLGLGCIIVPQQSTEEQPFLMKRVYEGEQEIQQIVFGIARRSGSSNIPLTVVRLYQAVQQGKASVPERLARIEGQLAELMARGQDVAPAPPRQVPADALTDRIKRVSGNE